MPIKLLITAMLFSVLAGCANLTELGDDASIYDSIPPQTDSAMLLSGMKVYVFAPKDGEEYPELGWYDSKMEQEHRKFILSHIKPKVVALGAELVSSIEQADIGLKVALRTESTGGTEKIFNYMFSTFTAWILPVYEGEKVVIRVAVSNPNGELSEVYSTDEDYSAWYGGTLTLWTTFGENNKVEAINNVTNKIFTMLEEDGIIEEISYEG